MPGEPMFSIFCCTAELPSRINGGQEGIFYAQGDPAPFSNPRHRRADPYAGSCHPPCEGGIITGLDHLPLAGRTACCLFKSDGGVMRNPERGFSLEHSLCFIIVQTSVTNARATCMGAHISEFQRQNTEGCKKKDGVSHCMNQFHASLGNYFFPRLLGLRSSDLHFLHFLALRGLVAPQ